MCVAGAGFQPPRQLVVQGRVGGRPLTERLAFDHLERGEKILTTLVTVSGIQRHASTIRGDVSRAVEWIGVEPLGHPESVDRTTGRPDGGRTGADEVDGAVALGEDVDVGAVDALKRAQRSWIGYRDGQCELAGFEARGGSMEPMLVSGCLADLTRKRTAELKSVYETED